MIRNLKNAGVRLYQHEFGLSNHQVIDVPLRGTAKHCVKRTAKIAAAHQADLRHITDLYLLALTDSLLGKMYGWFDPGVILTGAGTWIRRTFQGEQRQLKHQLC